MSDTVLVTGAFGLVGSATVRALAAEGRAVVATDLGTEANRAKAQDLPSGARAQWADLTAPAEVQRLIDELKRTHDAGALRASDIGKEVVLCGWVQSRRDHGSIVFVDLRDREGITQVVFDPETSPPAHAVADQLRPEWVIGLRGVVRSRGEQFSKKEGKMISAANPNHPTGEIEVSVLEATIFNRAETPPFAIEDQSDTREEVRLEHRYLDLRRAPLQRALRVTHAIAAKSADFRFAEPWKGLETLPRAGTVIGWSEGEPVTTPYDNCVLIMPSTANLRPGVTVVRLAQPIT